MHYRTEAISFLEPPDAFLEALGAPVERLATSEIGTESLGDRSVQPPVALLAAPVAVGAVRS
jgi:hypothetical protein